MLCILLDLPRVGGWLTIRRNLKDLLSNGQGLVLVIVVSIHLAYIWQLLVVLDGFVYDWWEIVKDY
jgi:hypothetical protein